MMREIEKSNEFLMYINILCHVKLFIKLLLLFIFNLTWIIKVKPYLYEKGHLPIITFMSYFEGTSIVTWTKEIFLLRGEVIWCLSDLKSTIPVLLLMRIQLDVDMERYVHIIPLDLNCRSFLYERKGIWSKQEHCMVIVIHSTSE